MRTSSPGPPGRADAALAATNRPDALDPALRRPGRFDREVLVPLPGRAERAAILAAHARGKNLGPDTDLDEIAAATPGFSGADLAGLVNEAAVTAVRGGRTILTAADFAGARDRVLLGTRRTAGRLTRLLRAHPMAGRPGSRRPADQGRNPRPGPAHQPPRGPRPAHRRPARRGPGPERTSQEQDTAMAADGRTTDTPARLGAHELVLLHGQPGSPADWQQVAGRLPAPLHAIAADRPGYGASQLPASGFAANARAVLDDLDSRGIARAVLVGHSYGGGVALSAASLAPGRVAAVVLLASVGPGCVTGWDRLLAAPAQTSCSGRRRCDRGVPGRGRDHRRPDHSASGDVNRRPVRR